MADVRCPMCGKTNPAEADVCQYCQARLRPLGSKPGSNAAPPTPAQPDPQPPASGDETDWLRELMGSDSTPEAASESDEQPHPEAGVDDADWLGRIRQRTQEEQDAISKIGPKPNLDAAHSQDAEFGRHHKRVGKLVEKPGGFGRYATAACQHPSSAARQGFSARCPRSKRFRR